MWRIWLSALAVTAATLVGAPTPAGAEASTCAPTDPPPIVVSAAATNVVIGSARRRENDLQSLFVRVRDACGGQQEYQGCAFDPVRPCFTGTVTMHRTAAASSDAARRCGRFLNTFDHATGVRPAPTDEPGVVEVGFAHGWDAYDDMEEHQGPFNNACAGSWDLTAVFSHTTSDGGTATGPAFFVTRAFSVLRRSSVTTDASPEPVRVGGAVTVRGRLVRADWSGRSAQPYAGQRVALQRRSATGVYTTLRWVRTGTDGRLRTTLRALSTPRCYRWVYPGSSTTARATGNGDCVSVSR